MEEKIQFLWSFACSNSPFQCYICSLAPVCCGYKQLLLCRCQNRPTYIRVAMQQQTRNRVAVAECVRWENGCSIVESVSSYLLPHILPACSGGILNEPCRTHRGPTLSQDYRTLYISTTITTSTISKQWYQSEESMASMKTERVPNIQRLREEEEEEKKKSFN